MVSNLIGFRAVMETRDYDGLEMDIVIIEGSNQLSVSSHQR